MANPAYPAGAFFKDRMKPSVLDKRDKESEHDRKLAAAYRKVEAREHDVCQISNAPLSPQSRDPKRLREHHHLKGRNVRPEWVYEPKRIILVSRYIHQLLTDKVLLIDSTDATKPLKVRWNRNIVKGQPPMRLENVA